MTARMQAGGERPGMEAVVLHVPSDRLSDLLCSALEGGSNYWYFIEDYDKHGAEFLSDAPMAGGWLRFRTLENESIGGKDRWMLDRATVVAGAAIMAEKCPKAFADMMAENDDATTGDVFLQCCLFGEVVFG